MPKILVIEDEVSVRANIVRLLKLEDYDVIDADNGIKGVTLAKEQTPDLILCDVMMPGLDGYGVLSNLRADPITATTPLIFLTAKVAKEDLRQGMELGASDYIDKPFKREDLLKAIQTQLKKNATIKHQAEEKLKALRNSISLSIPHELITPLFGIKGFSEIIRDSAENLSVAELRNMATDIYTSAERLEHLIENFLLYSKLELIASHSEKLASLKQEITPSTTSILTQVIKQKIQQFNREKDVFIASKDCAITISQIYFKKICEELIDNAIKYSQHGQLIYVISEINLDKYILKITNQGQGMTPEQINNIGAYMQFDRDINEQQGTGLGLQIVKRLAQLHGGEVKINSIRFKETTVQVDLPIVS